MVRRKESDSRQACQPLPEATLPKAATHKRPVSLLIFTFCVCIAFWVILSGRFDALHLAMGVVSSLIVSFISSDLLLHSASLKPLPRVWFRFIRYIPWLIFQVFVANVHVMCLAFHPKMMTLIDPQIIRFKSRLKGDIALVTLANSITLTPGTISVDVSASGEVIVHMIDVESGQTLPWIMDMRIAEIFGE